MDKKTAYDVLRAHHYPLSGLHNTTYASKNATCDLYWANPRFQLLKEDWTLILNDTINKRLYVFIIHAHAFPALNFVARADRPDIIDLEIKYGDYNFTDTRSKIPFKNYLYVTTDYKGDKI